MAYRIRSGESVDDAVRRICLEQLDKAANDVSGGEVGIHQGVHQARKRFKKIRAVVRLLRPALGDDYAAENAWFRDEARDLSPLRDASALVETIDRLGETFADQVDEAYAPGPNNDGRASRAADRTGSPSRAAGARPRQRDR